MKSLWGLIIDLTLAHIYTSSVPLYLLQFTFYAPMRNFDHLCLKLCLTKNNKNLILWKYSIRQFKKDLTWLYYSNIIVAIYKISLKDE